MTKALKNFMEKREKILESAGCLFLSIGYQNTSMDRVAKGAGLTKQTVYRYFPSKVELFKAFLVQMSPEGKEYCFGDGSVKEELESFAREFVTLHLTRQRLGLFRLLISESEQCREIGDAFFEMAPSVRHRNLADFISQKIRTEDPGKDARLFAAMLLYVRTGILMGVIDIPDQAWINSHCAYVTDLFLSARLVR